MRNTSLLTQNIRTHLIFFLCLIPMLIASQAVQAQQEYFKHVRAQLKKYSPPRKDFAIVIDYRKNILTDRLYILDLVHDSILLSSRVSHARKSGLLYPKKYSNIKGSEMSSMGNYITGKKIISPKFGYAMLVRGLDAKVNSNAQIREIIFHSDSKMKSKWSKGCFATPEAVNKKIIDLTSNGVFVCVIPG